MGPHKMIVEVESLGEPGSMRAYVRLVVGEQRGGDIKDTPSLILFLHMGSSVGMSCVIGVPKKSSSNTNP